MSVAIRTIREATTEEWDRIWNNCDYATYFHSREWAEVWRDYTCGQVQPHALLFEFSDGMSAILALTRQALYRNLVFIYKSSEAGTYGGWISDEKLTQEHSELIIRYMMKKLDELVWRLNPYDPIVQTLAVDCKLDITHAAKLSEDFDAVYKRWSKGHKAAAKQAINLGVRVRIASSLSDWQEYYEVYKGSLQRWGEKASSSYEWRLFRLMFDRKSDKIRLWLAEYEDKIIAGALCFYAKKHVVYWHGAALEEFFHLRPANLLMYEAICHACKNCYDWFDFNPSGGHEGVKAFKKSFGTEILPAPVIKKSNFKARIFKTIAKLAKAYRI